MALTDEAQSKQQIDVDPNEALSVYSQRLANATHEVVMLQAALNQATRRIAELEGEKELHEGEAPAGKGKP